jgi:putative ABC transport system permease protein
MLQARGAHKWVIYLDRTQNTPVALRTVQGLLGSDFVVIPWYQAADFYNKTVRLFSRQVLVMKLIIALVVILSISNTMMMAVMERISEIATAMALGVRRARVLSRFLAEGLFIGVIGGAVGVVLGYLLAAGISKVGIPMPPPPGMARSFVGEILVTPGLVLDALLLSVVTALVASAYPAWKASRMIIADALRHGR